LQPHRGTVRRTPRIRGRRWTDDRGANPVELAILLPLIVSALFGGLQVSMYFMARSEALTAAQAGVVAQRGYHAPSDAAQTQITAYVNDGPGWLVLDPPPTVATTSTDVTVTVVGHSFSMVPGWAGWTVTEAAHGSLERVTQPGSP
jgi:hypothetical protein